MGAGTILGVKDEEANKTDHVPALYRAHRLVWGGGAMKDKMQIEEHEIISDRLGSMKKIQQGTTMRSNWGGEWE